MQLKLSLKGPVEPSSDSLQETHKLCPVDARNYLESSQHQITAAVLLVEHVPPALKNVGRGERKCCIMIPCRESPWNEVDYNGISILYTSVSILDQLVTTL